MLTLHGLPDLMKSLVELKVNNFVDIIHSPAKTNIGKHSKLGRWIHANFGFASKLPHFLFHL
jgi:hypothetical protein